MWPVQTLTLLLCLTDEEQLFAQSLPVIAEPVPVEHVVPAPEVLNEESDLVLQFC